MYFGNLELEKIAAKTDGVNNNNHSGFYQDVKNKNIYFIKLENDLVKLFMELFAAKVIEQLIQEKIIEHDVSSCFVTTDYFCSDQNHYLIQNKVNFIELCKMIGTADINGRRDAVYENTTLITGNKYADIPNNIKNPYGLSVIFLISILIGDNSVHSGNIGVLNEGDNNKFVRFDFGAAFRQILQSENIWSPAEYKGPFNSYKFYTKNYIANYKLIPGFLPRVMQRAQNIDLRPEGLNKILVKAYNEMPKIFEGSIKEIAKYMGADDNSDINNLLNKLSNKMCERLTELKNIQPTESLPQGILYQSGVKNNLLDIKQDEYEYDVIPLEKKDVEIQCDPQVAKQDAETQCDPQVAKQEEDEYEYDVIPLEKKDVETQCDPQEADIPDTRLEQVEKIVNQNIFWAKIWIYIKIAVLTLLTGFALQLYTLIKHRDCNLYGRYSIFTSPYEKCKKIIQSVPSSKPG